MPMNATARAASPNSALPSLAGRVDAIAIGTSAGGIEALAALLPALPAGTRASVFVVIHLPRDARSLLVEIFQPRCALPVREAIDKEPVEPGTIYVAPPDYHLLIDAGPALALSIDAPVHHSRPSIDVLFESAADIYRARLLGIVLTGGNEDGAAGLAAIRGAGGLALVQDPQEAQVRAMPEAALARVAGADVLTLERIAALLGTLAPPNDNPTRGVSTP